MRFLMGFLQIGGRRSAGGWGTPCGGMGYALRGVGVTPCGGDGLRPAGDGLRACFAGGGTRSAGQGEIGGFRFPPLFPLTPSPLETSRDTLHPGTGVTTRTNRPAGRVRGLGYGLAVRCGVCGIRFRFAP